VIVETPRAKVDVRLTAEDAREDSNL
jgi:hypothetical protein